MKLKNEVPRKQKAIYDTLPLSIQNDLKPHYEALSHLAPLASTEASDVKGAKSCERMKRILKENVEKEVTNNMFENAQSKMKSQLSELKEEIVLKLKEEMSILLKLALLQQDQLAVKLSDIENECREMKKIYESLKNIQ
ncbi:hypothetical protein lerEdw1_015324 [Lerista edwardsae]|nr:hypothetical protein lerEdw1_015324 [Lerista edwardsae]